MSRPRQEDPAGYCRLPDLQWLRSSEEGDEWLSSLPRLVIECAQQWAVSVGSPFIQSHLSLVLPAERGDGTHAVLKLQFPDRESEHEAAALEVWDGNGAVRLLAADSTRRALLIERCMPGRPLSSAGPQNGLGVFMELLPHLWVPARGPFRSLAEEASHWTTSLEQRWERAGRPFERTLIICAIRHLTELAASQSDPVLIHQDLHADNVLSAERQPWLAIDPKPLLGEREFSLAPVIRGGELGHTRRLARRRLDALSGELGLDRDRARGWAIGQAVAWAFDNSLGARRNIDVARWLLDDERTRP